MNRNTSKVFWGLFFVAGAIFVLVSSMNFFPGINAFTFILAVLLAAGFIRSLVNLEFAGMLFSLAFLAILFDDQLGITNITPWPVIFAAGLASVGLGMLFNNHKSIKIHHRHDGEGFSETVNEADGSTINYGTSFGSSIKYVNSNDFRSANLDCTFSAMKVYFDNASIVGDGATINLNVTFSGVELYIPKEWNVVNHATATFGSIDEKNRPGNYITPTVILTGTVSFAGVEIIYI